MYITFEKGSRGQLRSTKLGSWPAVTGFDPVIPCPNATPLSAWPGYGAIHGWHENMLVTKNFSRLTGCHRVNRNERREAWFLEMPVSKNHSNLMHQSNSVSLMSTLIRLLVLRCSLGMASCHDSHSEIGNWKIETLLLRINVTLIGCDTCQVRINVRSPHTRFAEKLLYLDSVDIWSRIFVGPIAVGARP